MGMEPRLCGNDLQRVYNKKMNGVTKIKHFNKLHKDTIYLLFRGSLRAIPFNIVLALLLTVDLYFQPIPFYWVGLWFSTICILSGVRWVFCQRILKNGFHHDTIQSSLIQFLILTFLMGLTWGFCYGLSIYYLGELHEFITLLVFGGMCAGAIASLSVWLAAYIAYILPIFLPAIIYNYTLLDVDRSILATMFTLFILMLIVNAKLNNELLNQTFKLSHEKEDLITELQVLSTTDVLTGLYNRRHFEDIIYKEFSRGKRNKYDLNLISIDIDNFKLINDNFGHPYGDKFLQYIASMLTKTLARANDIVFRLGGDEFAAILINITMDEALERCKQIKDHFSQQSNFPDFILLNSPVIFSKVTLSMGLVYIPFDTTSTITNAVIAADKALYQSKQEGKNKIIIKKL